MEINFDAKTVRAFRESTRQVKRTQVSIEGVVPDVCDDIGRLFSVQTNVLLKSKDLTTRGVSVTGELSAVLFYINELENRVFDLHFLQSFSLDFDLAEPDPDMLTQIHLFIGSAEARTLNPRKVSITVEVGGELIGFVQTNSKIAAIVPETEESRIYTRHQSTKSALVNAVCEKTFVVNEQFTFSAGKCVPERLVSQKIDFRVADSQMVGSKVLMKGSLIVSVCYMTEDCDHPDSAEFTAPFSQLVDIGQEETDVCGIRIEPTSAYFNLIDNVSGEKALDAEIHAVAQIVSRFRQEIDYIADAYAADYPASLTFEEWKLFSFESPEKLLLESEERIKLPEDCADVLCVMTSLGNCAVNAKGAEAAVNLDVLYRTENGGMSSARRMFAVSSDNTVGEASLLDARIMDSYLRPDGRLLNGRISIELWLEKRSESVISCVAAMTLDEDDPFDISHDPTVTAVRVDRESVWELAKYYHSSCERIEALNRIEGPIRGKILLIPKKT